MNHTLFKFLSAISALLTWGAGMAAQDFNPTNPPEPEARYKLTVTASPAGIAKASGTGRYTMGSRVYVNTSVSDTDYEFKRWEIDGSTVSTSRSFYYTTGSTDAELTAVYEFVKFNPDSPSEPSEGYKWRLYLECEPSEACSFNLDNGSRHVEGDRFTVRAYASQGFIFNGWFDGSTKLSDDPGFAYTMPGHNNTLTARFTFVPDSPDEPQGGNQENVDNTVNPDVNSDGTVNTTDATTVVAYYLTTSQAKKNYDLNKDNEVNVTDATIIVSNYLEN